MTGPGHYREAERLLSLEPLQRTETGEHDDAAIVALMAEAQVHATLALAAATAVNDAEQGMRVSDWQEWIDTCGVAL